MNGGVSNMSRTITKLRTRLIIENVSDLMFISINKPPIEDFNAQLYVKIGQIDDRLTVSTLRDKKQTRKKINYKKYDLSTYLNNFYL